jgi:hypothetical protein
MARCIDAQIIHIIGKCGVGGFFKELTKITFGHMDQFGDLFQGNGFGVMLL